MAVRLVGTDRARMRGLRGIRGYRGIGGRMLTYCNGVLVGVSFVEGDGDFTEEVCAGQEPTPAPAPEPTPTPAPEPTISGSIAGLSVWKQGLSQWQTAPIALAKGDSVHLAVSWTNNGEATITGEVRCVITKPNGTTAALSAVANQNQAAGPGSGWVVQFAPFTADQEGTYTAQTTLLHQGSQLASRSFTVGSVPTPAPAPAPAPPQTFTRTSRLAGSVTNQGNAVGTYSLVVVWSWTGANSTKSETLAPGATGTFDLSRDGTWELGTVVRVTAFLQNEQVGTWTYTEEGK